jgi:hypothetical protein
MEEMKFEKTADDILESLVTKGYSEAELLTADLFRMGGEGSPVTLDQYLMLRLPHLVKLLGRCFTYGNGRKIVGTGYEVYVEFSDDWVYENLFDDKLADQIIEECERFYREPVTLNFKKVDRSQIPSQSEPFYKTRAWLSVRYKALVRSNRECELCRRSVLRDRVQLHVDHIKPRSKYPELELDIGNLQVLCAECNIGKSNDDETDWRLRR